MSYLLKSRKTSSSRWIKIKWDFISRQNRVTRTDHSTWIKNKIKQKDKLYETLAPRPWPGWAPWLGGVELGNGGCPAAGVCRAEGPGESCTEGTLRTAERSLQCSVEHWLLISTCVRTVPEAARKHCSIMPVPNIQSGGLITHRLWASITVRY